MYLAQNSINKQLQLSGLVWFMMFNDSFNNISVLSCMWSVLMVEETGVPGENHWPIVSHWETLSYNFVSSTPHFSGIRTQKRW